MTRLTVGTNGALDGANPYLRLLSRALSRTAIDLVEVGRSSGSDIGADVLHLHWPEHAFVSRYPGAWRLRPEPHVRRLRDRRTPPALWTVHNLTPHRTKGVHFARRSFTRNVIRNLAGWVSLSERGIQLAERAYPELVRVPVEVIPHHNYHEVTGTRFHEPHGDAIHFGQLRANKGTSALVEVWGDLRPPHIGLTIAGERRLGAPNLEHVDALPQGVELRLGHLPESELVCEVAAARIAVLPFAGGLNSGSVLFALSCSTPVLVPSTPVFDELSSQIGEGWLMTYTGPLSPQVLEEAIAWASASRPDRPDLSFCAIDRVARLHADSYRRLAGGG